MCSAQAGARNFMIELTLFIDSGFNISDYDFIKKKCSLLHIIFDEIDWFKIISMRAKKICQLFATE